MSIIVRGSRGKFNPAPEGVHRAVLVDVIPLGDVETQWGMKSKVELRWQIASLDPETNQAFIVRERYTASLHEMSKLTQHLAGLLGRGVTDAERRSGLDLEELIGRCCQLQVSHNIGSQGGTFANVDACIPLPKGTPALKVSSYVRQRDRENDDEPPPPEEAPPWDETFPSETPAPPQDQGR